MLQEKVMIQKLKLQRLLLLILSFLLLLIHGHNVECCYVTIARTNQSKLGYEKYTTRKEGTANRTVTKQ